MRSDFSLICLLATLLLIPPSILGASIELDDSLSTDSPGRIVDAVIVDLNTNATEGDGENARRGPLVIELHTATWCSPCRPAETQLNEMLNVWPGLIALHHHSSPIDPLSVIASNETKSHQGVHGYPTMVIDGRWVLNGSNQTHDLFDLVAEITSKGGTRSSSPGENKIENWSIVDGVISVNLNVSDPSLRADVFLVVDGVNHVPLGLLSDTVVAGQTDVDVNSTVQISLNGSRASSIGDIGKLVMIIRNPGDAELVVGSDRPLYDGFFSTPPVIAEPNLFEENKWIIWLVLFGGIAALLPALQHTFPLLWTSRRTSIEEE